MAFTKQELEAQILPVDSSKKYVFASYSSADYERVYQTVIALQQRGVNIWIDTALREHAGDDWQRKVFRTLNSINCKGILYFISPNSIQSPPVLAELTYSAADERRTGARELKFVPITVDDTLTGSFADWRDGVLEECGAKLLSESDKHIIDNVYSITNFNGHLLKKSDFDFAITFEEVCSVIFEIERIRFGANPDEIIRVDYKDVESIAKNIPAIAINQPVGEAIVAAQQAALHRLFTAQQGGGRASASQTDTTAATTAQTASETTATAQSASQTEASAASETDTAPDATDAMALYEQQQAALRASLAAASESDADTATPEPEELDAAALYEQQQAALRASLSTLPAADADTATAQSDSAAEATASSTTAQTASETTTDAQSVADADAAPQDDAAAEIAALQQEGYSAAEIAALQDSDYGETDAEYDPDSTYDEADPEAEQASGVNPDDPHGDDLLDVAAALAAYEQQQTAMRVSLGLEPAKAEPAPEPEPEPAELDPMALYEQQQAALRATLSNLGGANQSGSDVTIVAEATAQPVGTAAAQAAAAKASATMQTPPVPAPAALLTPAPVPAPAAFTAQGAQYTPVPAPVPAPTAFTAPNAQGAQSSPAIAPTLQPADALAQMQAYQVQNSGVFEFEVTEGRIYIKKYNDSPKRTVVQIPDFVYGIKPIGFLAITSPFAKAKNLTNILPGKGLRDISYLFAATKFDVLDLSAWDVSQIECFSGLFHSAKIDRIIGLDTWNVGNGRLFDYMFYYLHAKEVGDLSRWNVANGTNFEKMFWICDFEQAGDLGNWNVANGVNFKEMFYGARLKTLGDLSRWNVSNGMHFNKMFASLTLEQDANVDKWLFDDRANITDIDKGYRIKRS